jgi:hypothetical protein
MMFYEKNITSLICSSPPLLDTTMNNWNLKDVLTDIFIGLGNSNSQDFCW